MAKMYLLRTLRMVDVASLALVQLLCMCCNSAAHADTNHQFVNYAQTSNSPILYFDSHSAVELNNAGVRALHDGDYKMAIIRLRQALAIAPSYLLSKQNLAIAFNNYGLALQNQPAESIKQFHDAVYLDPDNLLTKRNLEGVIIVLRKDPKSFKDRVALGDEAGATGDFAGAVVEYRAALGIKDDPVVAKKLDSASAKADEDWKPPPGDRTEGIDFGSYMAALDKHIKQHWFHPTCQPKKIVVTFKIHHDGKFSDLKMAGSSGSPTHDQAAMDAVKSASPFKPLPPDAPEDIDVQYTFDYNVYPLDKRASKAFDH